MELTSLEKSLVFNVCAKYHLTLDKIKIEKTEDGSIEIVIYNVYDNGEKTEDAKLRLGFDVGFSVSLYLMMNNGCFEFCDTLNIFNYDGFVDVLNNSNNLFEYLEGASRFAY